MLTGAQGQSDTMDTATQTEDKDMQAYTQTEEHAHVLSCTRTVVGGLRVPDIHYTFRQISGSG